MPIVSFARCILVTQPMMTTTKSLCQSIKRHYLVAGHSVPHVKLEKQTQGGAGSSTQVPLQDQQDLLQQENLVPASKVSIGQYMSAMHGHLPHTKGKEAKSKQYTDSTIFVDHSTTYIHHANQVSLHIGKTLKAKKKFEGFA
jgi:hypothetical protein